ncbi:hypothetical protein D3C85_1244570 [compost metagenome]
MRNVECSLRLVQFFALPLPLLVQPANAVQRFFHIGETIDDRPTIGFQQFFLTGRGLVAFGAQASVVEHGRKQSCAEVVEGTAQNVARAVGAGADFRAEGDGRQHRGAGHGDVGLGRGQLRFGPGDVRATAEQLAGHAGIDGWP